jgi:aspartate carbamoyltransferase regulatory subunit
MKTTQQVSKLKQGTVLDHLHAGTALQALRVLDLAAGQRVTIGMNLTSKRLGRKDIIKIDSYELNEDQAAKVALISPDATRSIIRDYKVAEKHDLHLPVAFRGLIRCPNPSKTAFTECRIWHSRPASE